MDRSFSVAHRAAGNRMLDGSATHPSLCFVAHNALGALTGRADLHAGGIERQQALMAKWLARHGHRVGMITWDEDVVANTVHDSVELFRLCRRDAGLRGLRFFVPRWTSLNGALARADADIYYYNCGDLCLGQIALWTRAHHKRLIFSVASDADCESTLPNLRGAREKALYRYGLKSCDAIIVQTQKQQRLLQREFGRDSVVLPMPCEGLPAIDRANDDGSVRVLWIGRISAEKRPDWLLDVAERLPQRQFEIVGAANAATAYARSVVERAQRMPNVTLTGRVPYDHVADCYRRASILCSTSAYEGFPNIFLEAWSAGIPVVATCDPDELIATRNLGRIGDTVGELAAAIELLAQSSDLRRQVGTRAREYFRERHTVDHAMQGFVDFFVNSMS
jgi:glycosyltransferase involved in cell wall biosynthesis